MERVNSDVTNGEGREAPSPRGLERALRDLVPTALAAGAAAVAVAAVVGGSTSRLHTPFVPHYGAGTATSAGAAPEAVNGKVTVRVAPKRARGPVLALVDLVPNLAAIPAVTTAGGAVTDSAQSLIFGPTGPGAGRLAAPAVLVGVDLEQAVVPPFQAPAPLGPPESGAPQPGAVPLVDAGVPAPGTQQTQQTQRLHQPRRQKAPKIGRAETEAEASVFQAASLSEFTLLSETETAPTADDPAAAQQDKGRRNDDGKDKGKAKGQDDGQGRGQEKDRPAAQNRPPRDRQAS
ncbi:MAG: hypothetical protein KY439_10530 [Actinobacteria bacterium]|nr:hypothetical protein [Actinomycetota bacterium]